jgi:Fe-S cluster assembly iron-binding protein IscA
MNIREDDLLSLTEAADIALSALFAPAVRPNLRIFLSFLSDSGPRLELAADEPTGDDAAFSARGWRFVVNRALLQQAAPLVVDCGEEGFVIRSSLDFSLAGGNCGGSCGTH